MSDQTLDGQITEAMVFVRQCVEEARRRVNDVRCLASETAYTQTSRALDELHVYLAEAETRIHDVELYSSGGPKLPPPLPPPNPEFRSTISGGRPKKWWKP